MLFNSNGFLFVFLPLVLLIFFSVAKWSSRASLACLTLASLFFYTWWDWHFLPILLVSIGFNFLMGKWLALSTNKRSLVLSFAVATNLSALFFYKYLDFAILSLNSVLHLSWEPQALALPLGISFFTFTQIAYLVDVHRHKAREPGIVDYTLFVTYFPHLIAGPILHHAQMMPQFRNAEIFRPQANSIVLGLSFLTIGLIKKVLIADNLAPFATPVFSAASSSASLSTAEAWVGTAAYTLQLYFDFSGYCDMAIGISRMFNIDLPLNFASPYRAASISEFWRRWHMTLSQFLRDYLYIALGGNRHGQVRRYTNLLATMLLGGLWHGANWTFVLWGALHGSYLVVNHIFTAWRLKRGLPSLPAIIAIPLTLIAVVMAWVPFRADDISTSVYIWQSMLGMSGTLIPLPGLAIVELSHAAYTILAGTLLVLFCPNSQTLMTALSKHLEKQTATSQSSNHWILYGLLVGILFTITVMSLSRVSEFLYFQF